VILTQNKRFKGVLKAFDGTKIQILIDPLTHTYYIPARTFFEVNNTV
jgi:hypothetical protein